MTATIPSSALVVAEPVLSEPEQLALAGFLASYSGLTREAYMLDLRQFTTWCHQHGLRLFAVRRADIECFARDLEAKGRARSTVSRRLATITGLCKYAVEEDLLAHSPTRRPRTSGGRAWTTNPMPSAWTATRSVRCSSRPGWAPRPSTR